MPDELKPMNRVYQMYNIEKDRKGEHFTLCDGCHQKWEPPSTVIHSKIADQSLEPCNQCEKEGSLT